VVHVVAELDFHCGLMGVFTPEACTRRAYVRELAQRRGSRSSAARSHFPKSAAAS
jgi:hypothetical protein